MNGTVLDALVERIEQALTYNPNAAVSPIALLWPDETSQWSPVIDRVRAKLPVVSCCGFSQETSQGPAYWIRCVVMGTVDAGLPPGQPIVYLPDVGRGDLRAVEACSPELAPIAELQYRSQWFSHPNGRDWTVRSFLSHGDRGLGLKVADDAETTSVLLHALDRLLDLSVDALRTQVLDADFFRDLIDPDPVRSLLGWLDDPVGFRPRLDEGQWLTFLQQCRASYGFDPLTDGEIVAARKLGRREGPWAHIWKRFTETPERYPRIPERLRQAKPMELSFEADESWPQDNEAAEEQLRNLLLDFPALTTEGARKEAGRLDTQHSWRRGTVWAELDRAPLAFAIEQLVTLADITAQPLSGNDLGSITSDYSGRGWRADDALLRALAATSTPADRDAVGGAAATIYRPWVEAGANDLQAVVGPAANSNSYETGPPVPTSVGTVSVFVDGLRLDIAHRLKERLVSIGLEVDLVTAPTALPTVTQTTKPALVPVASGALSAGPELHPSNSATGTKATIQVLRSLMTSNGVQVLSLTEKGDPSGTAWTEAGQFDHRGHDVGIGLVDYLDEEVERVFSRTRELLDAGWSRVEIVTDHGWILLPGGMEKVELPVATTDVKKGRCARLKDGASVDVPTVPWFWDQDVRIALAPGATCFEANKEYEHGGVSPQECIVPRLTVSAGTAANVTAGPEITKVKWLRLLCRIEFTGLPKAAVVDIRGLPADSNTSIAEEVKETSSSGKVSLVVADEEHEGESAHLVVISSDGQILVQREVVVGSNR